MTLTTEILIAARKANMHPEDYQDILNIQIDYLQSCNAVLDSSLSNKKCMDKIKSITEHFKEKTRKRFSDEFLQKWAESNNRTHFWIQ